MGNRLLTQVILIVTSGAIILTFIMPAFEEISSIQDDIVKYENTVSRASELNIFLQDLVATERNISQSEYRRLETYLPTDINDVVVMRDIQNIFKISDVQIIGLSSLSEESLKAPSNARVEGRADDRLSADEEAPKLVFKDFELSFFGTYEDLKQVMQGLEMNAYPLEVVALSFGSSSNVGEGSEDTGLPPGTMSYSVALRAFALPGAE